MTVATAAVVEAPGARVAHDDRPGLELPDDALVVGDDLQDVELRR
jgi:hypothetical protein